ncbi:hypothetical protein JKP88DRAFT_158100 [Tribonema minus]|uniref:Kelch repeat protein n=1 Tax=Tribonema minus TaxID=303371 RepID=A0A836CD99_9STRA|nr:hypothetical protein JKP88DRAFT_158100 [Tribonema minus]
MLSAKPQHSHHRWLRLRTFGDVPTLRSGQGAAVVAGSVYIFGGCDAVMQNDIYRFDVDTHEWCAVTCDDGPSPRAAFGMCSGPGQYDFTVACGCGLGERSAQSDIWSFDVRRRRWRKLFESPRAAYGVSICWHGSTLLLWGGTSGVEYYASLYAFTLHTGSIVRVNTSGCGPSKRYKHVSFVYGNDMYVCGGGTFSPTERSMGMHKLNLTTLVWQRLGDDREGVSIGRTACTCCFDVESSKAWVFGGFDSDAKRLQAFQTFDVVSNAWAEVGGVKAETSPAPRAFHSMVLCRGALFMFLGADGNVCYDDVWRYSIRSTPPPLQHLATRAFLTLPGGECPHGVPGEMRTLIDAVKQSRS